MTPTCGGGDDDSHFKLNVSLKRGASLGKSSGVENSLNFLNYDGIQLKLHHVEQKPLFCEKIGVWAPLNRSHFQFTQGSMM